MTYTQLFSNRPLTSPCDNPLWFVTLEHSKGELGAKEKTAFSLLLIPICLPLCGKDVKDALAKGTTCPFYMQSANFELKVCRILFIVQMEPWWVFYDEKEIACAISVSQGMKVFLMPYYYKRFIKDLQNQVEIWLKQKHDVI